MKKTELAVAVVAVLALVPSVGSAVDLDPGCGYMYDEVTGLQAELADLRDLLSQVGFTQMPATWQEVDIETVSTGLDGDGIPDHYQMALLAATMCSGAKGAATVIGQFETNTGLYNTLMAQLAAVLTAATTPALDMQTVAADLEAWAEGLDSVETQALKDSALGLASNLDYDGTDLLSFVSDYEILVGALLPDVKECVAAIAGMSSEGRDSIWGVFGELFGTISALEGVLIGDAGMLAGVVLVAEALDGSLDEMPAQLKLDAVQLAEDLAGPALDGNDGFAHVLGALNVAPSFIVFDPEAKLASEPFSAAGNYDGTGLSNGATYDAMEAAGADMGDDAIRALWVQAVSGSGNGLWPGNPALSVAGVAGLVILAAVLVGAAAREQQRISSQ